MGYRPRYPATKDEQDPERAALLAVLKANRIQPHKRLGQVFLLSPFIAEEIVRLASPAAGDTVVEIGTGLGVLTLPLAESAAHIVGLEYDTTLAAYLSRTLAHRTVEIIRADALNYNYRELYERRGVKLKILGNLPYYLTSPLIFRLLDLRSCIDVMVFMVQQEVAERISAAPDSRSYGTLSIFTQLYCQVSHCLSVGRELFYPRPAVDSAVIRFLMRPTPLIPLADEQAFAKLVRVSFSQRRKTILNALKGSDYFCLGKEKAVAALEGAGIDPRRRPETVSIEEYGRLSALLFPPR